MQTMRDPKQLLLDSRAFAWDNRWASWWAVLSTFSIFVLLQAVMLVMPFLVVRIALSVALGLVIVRLFVIYHDYQHDTILRKSTIASVLMTTWGLFSLSPPSVWRHTHNYHHKHNTKLLGSAIGSFPMMTVEAYENATWWQRLEYRIHRHPLLFVFAYPAVFVFAFCIRPFLTSPRTHFDAGITLLVHLALIVGLLLVLGVDSLLLHLVLPASIASSIGAYLFFAQHNFPDAHIQHRSEWDYVTAALHSSSYIAMNPVLQWCTANIGYHHVHHMNHHIPFYRLPKVMAAMPELQSPGTTTLRPRDILACLRLKVWDPDQQKLVPYPTA